MASKGSKRTTASPAARAPASSIVAAVLPAVTDPALSFDAAPAEPAPTVPFAQAEPEAPGIEALIEAAQDHTAEAAQAADTAIETAEAVTTTAADTIADTTQKEDTIMATNFESTTNVAPLFGDMNARAKSAMEKTGKMTEEMTEFAKGNVEAMVEASRIAAKGLESLGQDAAEFGRKSFETATANIKTLASVKSPTEFFKLQNDFVRQSFDAFIAEASKSTETMLKLAGDAAQPLSNRMAVAADKVKTAA